LHEFTVPSESFTWSPPTHIAPAALHVPVPLEVLQTAPSRQSAFVVHAVLHAPALGSHVYAPQVWSVPGAQLPVPSHVLAARIESFWHFAGAHTVALSG